MFTNLAIDRGTTLYKPTNQQTDLGLIEFDDFPSESLNAGISQRWFSQLRWFGKVEQCQKKAVFYTFKTWQSIHYVWILNMKWMTITHCFRYLIITGMFIEVLSPMLKQYATTWFNIWSNHSALLYNYSGPHLILVGGFNPSDKYESQLGLFFPIWWENNPNVPRPCPSTLTRPIINICHRIISYDLWVTHDIFLANLKKSLSYI